MRRPVSQPLVRSWKTTMMPYAAHQVAEVVSRVCAAQRSSATAASAAKTAIAV
jgi:hypothetical protein